MATIKEAATRLGITPTEYASEGNGRIPQFPEPNPTLTINGVNYTQGFLRHIPEDSLGYLANTQSPGVVAAIIRCIPKEVRHPQPPKTS